MNGASSRRSETLSLDKLPDRSISRDRVNDNAVTSFTDQTHELLGNLACENFRAGARLSKWKTRLMLQRRTRPEACLDQKIPIATPLTSSNQLNWVGQAVQHPTHTGIVGGTPVHLDINHFDPALYR